MTAGITEQKLIRSMLKPNAETILKRIAVVMGKDDSETPMLIPSGYQRCVSTH
jgi:hypothetical protein